MSSEVCLHLNMNKKEFCLKKLQESFKKKQNELFKVNVQLREDHLRLRLKWMEEVGKEEILILLSMKPTNNLNHRDLSSFRRIHGRIKLKRKTVDYLENRIYQERHAKGCPPIEELRRICCVQADRARHLRIEELSMQQKANPSTVNQLVPKIRNVKDNVNSLNDEKIL